MIDGSVLTLFSRWLRSFKGNPLHSKLALGDYAQPPLKPSHMMKIIQHQLYAQTWRCNPHTSETRHKHSDLKANAKTVMQKQKTLKKNRTNGPTACVIKLLPLKTHRNSCRNPAEDTFIISLMAAQEQKRVDKSWSNCPWTMRQWERHWVKAWDFQTVRTEWASVISASWSITVPFRRHASGQRLPAVSLTGH